VADLEAASEPIERLMLGFEEPAVVAENLADVARPGAAQGPHQVI
jgi:hypothetical protein